MSAGLRLHPRLSIETASHVSGKSYDRILQQAEEAGMKDVYLELRKRVAGMHRQKAAQFEAAPI